LEQTILTDNQSTILFNHLQSNAYPSTSETKD